MNSLSECTVLIVDDVEANVDILVETLGEEYGLSVAMDGESALELARQVLPDLILLDIMMPGMSGYEVCERLKSAEATKGIPIVFLTAMADEQDEARGLALGAVDYITKPFNPQLVKARVRNHLELKVHRDRLEDLVAERTRELQLTQDVTIESMGAIAECRDPETGGHIKRTQSYVRILAEELKDHPRFGTFLDEATIELLYKSAPLHDVGKVGVPDHILLKPGKLTNEEFEAMKQHTVYGHDVIRHLAGRLGENSFLRLAREVAYTHQEKWDGSGYPQGLKGEEIPICGRLMAVADVYDALTSWRVYRDAMSHAEAVAIVREGHGAHFDPAVVDAFLNVQEEFRQTSLRFADRTGGA
jgi:putative two-component system response regulator